MNIKWNADKYVSDFSFVPKYGAAVMDLIDAAPGGRVLDLGCGSGALTRALSDRGFLVTGLDASQELLTLARQNYPGIDFVSGDAADFTLPEPVDVVFSNAVFHWIDRDRQPDMLRCVRRALRPGGQLVFEFGGHGNNSKIHAALSRAFSEYGYSYKMPFYFPTIAEYASLLEDTGFLVQYALLFDRPTPLSGGDGLKDWINMFVKAPFSAVKTERERSSIVDRAVDLLRGELLIDGTWYADYVRLRMKAVRL